MIQTPIFTGTMSELLYFDISYVSYQSYPREGTKTIILIFIKEIDKTSFFVPLTVCSVVGVKSKGQCNNIRLELCEGIFRRDKVNNYKYFSKIKSLSLLSLFCYCRIITQVYSNSILFIQWLCLNTRIRRG